MRAMVRRARPSSTVASTRGSISARATAAGRAASGSDRKRATMPGRSSLVSTRDTSSDVKTCPAMKRPSERPSRAFCVGMIAVCGIGRPSGWRNRAVTANQSAMPPTNPALAAACRNSAHGPGGRAKVPSIRAAMPSSSPVASVFCRRNARRSGPSGSSWRGSGVAAVVMSGMARRIARPACRAITAGP